MILIQTLRLIRQTPHVIGFFFFCLLITSCSGMKNPDRRSPANEAEGPFLTVRDRVKIFVSEHFPAGGSKNTGFYRLVSEFKLQKFFLFTNFIPQPDGHYFIKLYVIRKTPQNRSIFQHKYRDEKK